jgi:hypothetical protein
LGVQSLQDLGRDRGEGGYLVGAQAVEDEPSHRVDMGRRGLLDGSAAGVGEDNKCAPTVGAALLPVEDRGDLEHPTRSRVSGASLSATSTW